jgi:hypothetical protein
MFAIVLGLAVHLSSAEDVAGHIHVRAVDEIVRLDGRWLFTTGDDPTYAASAFDDSSWQPLYTPRGFGAQGHRDHVGPFWYRLHVHLPDGAASGQLAVQLSKIDSAYEVFFDGVRAGGRGTVDAPFVDAQDAPGLYPVPATAMADGEVVIAVRGRRSEQRASSSPERGGIFRGPLAFGETSALMEAAWARDRGGIIASAAIFIVGLYHLQLFRRRRDEKSTLWFALFCIAMAANMRMETDATHAFGTVLRAKLVYTALLLASVFFVQFLWPFLGERIRWWWRAHQGAMLIYLLFVLAWPTTWFLDITVPWLQLGLVVPLMLGTVRLIAARAWAGDLEARTVGLGTLTLVGALGINIILDRTSIELPLMFPYAMILFVLSMAVSFSNRFARLFQELDEKNTALTRMDGLAAEVKTLNAQLQTKVRDRSEELSRSLTLLVERGAIGGLENGTVLEGRWRVDKLLGAGGMGSVYAAVDLVTQMPVAIKVVRAKTASEIESLHRFLREARAVVRVDHPAVVRMLHVDVSSEGVFYQVQELVDGATLEEHLRTRGIDAAVVARMGAVLAEALAAAHARGVIHRDVKPSNIMLTDAAPGLKLVDFGVAKLVDTGGPADATETGSTPDSDHTGTGRLIGTPAYMAPEQRLLSSEAVTERVDVYALGLVLERALAGPAPLKPAQLGAPPAMQALLAKCQAEQASERPSAGELAASFARLADELGAPVVLHWGSGRTTGGDLTKLMKELARAT